MSDKSEILDRVRQIMADTFDLDDLVITPETVAADVDEWDSLSHIRLMVAVERAFGIRFTNAQIEDLQNVGDLIDAIAEKTDQPG